MGQWVVDELKRFLTGVPLQSQVAAEVSPIERLVPASK